MSKEKEKDKRDLQTVLGELKEFQEKYRGKSIPEDEATRWEELAAEAKQMQDEVARDEQVKAAEQADRKARELARDLTPTGENRGPASEEEKSEDHVGYLTLGDMAVASKGFHQFQETGKPKGYNEFTTQDVSAIRPKRRGLVKVTAKQIKEMQEKAVPDIGERVIPFDRDPDTVLDEERRELRIADVLRIVPTSANSVEWVRRKSYTSAAAPQTETSGGSQPDKKAEAAKEYELVTTPIRTHAVWMPVTEQQLDDWPQLAALINADLMHDLGLLREEQVMYGDGTGINFQGILLHDDVADARVEGGDTLIDQVRRGITDVRRAHLMPNAVIMDPLDWEQIVLEKGNDEHYIWVVVTQNQQHQIWALPVVETVAAENPDTGERNILVGDFQRGATLYDRQQTTVSSGWIDDQFIRNMRTLLVESRAGFAVRRPAAFRKIQTAAS